MTPPPPTASPDVADGRPRSLTDELRARSDADLAELLRHRPDLAHPVPADLAALATRAATVTSVGRALDTLDRLSWQVLEVLAVLPEPVSQEAVRAAVGVPDADGAVSERLGLLGELALLWGAADDLHLVRAVRDALGPYPCGLGPALADSHVRIRRYAADPQLLAAELAAAPPAAVEVLDHLRWGPPVGRLADADRTVTEGSARTPVEWLLARELLVAQGPDSVALPREVALHLRDGALLADVAWPPPSTAGPTRDPQLVDRTAGAHALTAVRLLGRLLDAWAVEPPGLLRSGGLAVRDLQAAARLLDTDPTTAALLIELGYVAGLLASDDEADPVWLPTPAYDVWSAAEPGTRWALLVRAWSVTTRAPGLVGLKTERDGRINALVPDTIRPAAPWLRRWMLGVLAAGAPGEGITPDRLLAALEWTRPRLAGPAQADLVRWSLREAELLGVTGLGALGTAGRALLADAGVAELAATVSALMPAPVDHIVLQADLTAIAPGPLEAGLARQLDLVADVESTGGATVYRFSETSIRRALDAGQDGATILESLARNSKTPVPQPLSYLVTDVARRHGAVRVGIASAYLRAEDEELIQAVLASRSLAGLGLVRLAPTAVACRAPVDEVLDSLRAAGFAPVAEAPDGRMVLRRKDSRRTAPVPPPPVLRGEPPAPDDVWLAGAVRALRAGDRATAVGRRARRAPATSPQRLPRSDPAATMAALRTALAAGSAVWIGYADTAGATIERVIDPVRLQGGVVTAYDHRTESLRDFAVSRITGLLAVDHADAAEPD
ncbi:MAG: DNA-binding protein [Actinomycetota bacterium]|nr:MAG: DNA-binding protein [Actinomycetota bacterium]